jgi:hypothetical protein
MRWIRPNYRDGDTRIHTFFAWFPVSVKKDDICETRWLTMVTVEQRLYCDWPYYYWINSEFIGEKKTNITKMLKDAQDCSELINAATKYVFEENGHKFSNNNNEAGDNFISFLAGANWVLNKYYQLDIAKSVMVEDTEALRNLLD